MLRSRLSRVRPIDVVVAVAAFGLTMGLLAGGGVDPHADQRDLDPLGVLLAALSTLPVALHRLSPLGVYAFVVLANTPGNSLDYPDGPPFGAAAALFFLASADPATRPPNRITIPVVVSLLVLHFTVFGVSQSEFPLAELLLGTTLWVAVWFVGDRVRIRRERMAELEEEARRAQRDAERERMLAVAEERTRIARDLHDSAGHALNVMLVHAGAARLLAEKDPARSRQALETIETVGREMLTEIDQLVRALRDGFDGARDVVELPSGLAALETLAERHRRAGMGVEIEVEGTPHALAPATDQAAYRIVQESLTNALLHGDGAARVRLTYGKLWLDLEVTNPARPATDGSAGHGIVGMRERAQLVGGVLEAGRTNGGFRVRARLFYAGRPES